MPLQTRSKSESTTPHDEDEPATTIVAEGESSRTSQPRSPLQATIGESIPVAGESERFDATSPEAATARQGSSETSSSRSRPRSMRSWEERDRRDHRDGSRGPGAGPQDQFLSPPNYKTSQHALSNRDPPPVPAMDHGQRRELDQVDLDADLTGPDDFLMLGPTFSEESPPRLPGDQQSPPSMDREPPSESKRPAAAGLSRRSPPPHHYGYQSSYPGASYRRSPRSGREGYNMTPSRGNRRGPPGPPPPPPGYYASYPPHGSPPQEYSSGSRSSPRYHPNYPPYHHYQPDAYWEGAHGQYPPYDPEDEIPPPPPSSTKKRPLSSDHPGSPRGYDGTPEPPSKTRSPFRSPPASASKQKFRPSPFFRDSPHLGTLGSFGMDTPSGTLARADFSPMGASYEELGDETVPLPFGGDRLRLSRSNSQEETGTPAIPRRLKDIASPMSDFWKELSPPEGLQNLARSPVAHYGYDEPASLDRPIGNAVTMSGNRGRGEPRMHSTPHGSVKKALWPRSDGPSMGTPGRLRLEIGSAGALSTAKAMEGINSMMHVRSSRDGGTPSNRGEGYPRGPPPPHLRGPPHPGAAYRSDMATPIKSSGHPYHQRGTPLRHQYPGSASKFPAAIRKDYPGSATKPRYAPPNSIPPSTGKENKKKVASPKSSPCNCKRSKCLKLYCECFAAEQFCQDCNCADCGNTPTAGAIRDKAIKDTRAKNPNAFKRRITVKQSTQGTLPDSGHNMGCKCKKSECLKKYCECFQAGVMCGGKCKCSDCLNYAGSQPLIDKRNKMKDKRGADLAMRASHEVWTQRRPVGARKPAPQPVASAAAGRRLPSKSPPGPGHMPPPHMMHPSPRGPPPHHGQVHHGHPPPYHGMPPHMRGPHPGYPHHMGMPMTPAGYPYPPPPHHHPHHMPPGESPHGMYPLRPGPPPSATHITELKRPAPKNVTPVAPTSAATPKTPGIRVEFDPASSRKKRKISPGQAEDTLPFFGKKLPEQPKTAALASFSFLSNDDLYNAGLVCKSWSRLAMDGELWKFEN